MTDERMRAVILTGHGGLEKLEYREDWPVPVPGPREVLIKVHACGMNNTDVNTRTGWYSKGTIEATTGAALEGVQDDDATWGSAPLTFPRIQGADVAGTVVAGGAESDPNLIGKRVMIDTWLRDWSDPMNLNKTGYYGSECDGGYAEYTIVDERNVHAIDSRLCHIEIASFATSYITAENMLNRANVASGDRVLITGASGGVGSALIQLAKRRGAETVAVVSAAKEKLLEPVAPDFVIYREADNLAAALKDQTGDDKVSVVADVVGGASFPDLIAALERGGRYTCAGAIAGPIVELDLRTFYLRDLTFTGATIVPPGTFADLVGYIERGEIKPIVAATYPLPKIREAQQAFIDKAHVGNIVIDLE
ncbi:MAG: alcohol dehydrogenase family protein [Pseudomonadota bacterium]